MADVAKQGMGTAAKLGIGCVVLMIMGFGSCVVLGVIGAAVSKSHASGAQNSRPSDRSLPTSVDGHPPPDSPATTFISTMKGYHEQYEQAPNGIKKSMVFNQARSFDKSFFANSMNNLSDWTGSLTALRTDKGGKNLVLRIDVGDQGFGGYKATFSDGSELVGGIPPGSPVYQAAADMKEDDCVTFSGRVDPERSVCPRSAP